MLNCGAQWWAAVCPEKIKNDKKKLDWCSSQVQKQREDRDSHFSACLDENIWVAICLFFFSIQFHPNMILDDNIWVCSFFFFQFHLQLILCLQEYEFKRLNKHKKK